MIVRSTVGGNVIRIRLSNEIGDSPAEIRVGAANIALHDKGNSVVAGSMKGITFNGKKDVVIPSKSFVYSDPIDMSVPALTDLVVSLYFPDKVILQSSHFVTRQVNYLSSGNETEATTLPATTKSSPYWFVVTGVDVQVSKPMALVAFGASIVDGTGGGLRVDSPAPWSSWPSRLGERLATSKNLSGVSVLNAGIAGNRVMSDDSSPTNGMKALDRFQRDVLEQRGVSCVIILEGTNDIGFGAVQGRPVTSSQLTAAYSQLIAQGHAKGLKVIGATLTPFSGVSAPYYSESNNSIREAVNQWIRTSGAYDGVIDFDAVLRDGVDPKRLQTQYDSGDHLHPNDAGYKLMADSVDLEMLQKLCLKP